MGLYEGLQRFAKIIRILSIILAGVIGIVVVVAVVAGLFAGELLFAFGWLLGGTVACTVILALGLIIAWIVEGFAQRE